MTLNVFRNLHPHLLNKFKKEYGKKLQKIFSKYDSIDCAITISIYFTFKGKRRRDLDNHGTVILKVLQDALVDSGVIPDDDTRVIDFISIGGETNCEEDTIKVTINERN